MQAARVAMTAGLVKFIGELRRIHEFAEIRLTGFLVAHDKYYVIKESSFDYLYKLNHNKKMIERAPKIGTRKAQIRKN